MAEIIFDETISTSTPSAGKVSFYADTTANPQLLFKDDGGTAVNILDSRNTVAQIANKDFADGTTTISNVSLTSKAVKFSLSGMTASVVLTIASAQSTSQTLTLPNITGADTVAVLAGIQTFTNKRINPRIGTTVSGATITPTGDDSDEYTVTALATAATIAAPSGTPVNGQKLILRIIDDGTPRALTWNAIYAVIGVTLPTTTVTSKYVYIGCIYNTQSSKWDVVAVQQQT